MSTGWPWMLELSRCWAVMQRPGRPWPGKAEKKEVLSPLVFPVSFITVSPSSNSPPSTDDVAVEMPLLPLIPLSRSNSRWGWACLFSSLQAQERLLYSSLISCSLFHLFLVLVLFTKLSEVFPIQPRWPPATPSHLLAIKGWTMHPWAAQNRLQY